MARFTGHGGVKLSLNGGDRASFGCEMRDYIRLRERHSRRSLLDRSVGIHRNSHDHGSTVRVWAVGNKLSGSKSDDFVRDNDFFYDLDEDSDDYDDDDEEEEEEELDREFDELSYFRGLVLDISYRPVNVVCWKRAICLEFMEKADVLEYYDQTVSSPQGSFFIPAVLRVRHLLQVVQRRRIKQVLSRKSIFYRDSYTCQYCSARENLTIDHVLPVSRGGGWTWENLVVACARCNSRKGQKTLEQANMKLLKTPKAPKDYDIFTIPLTSAAARMLKMRSRVPEEWEQYLPNRVINHAIDEAQEYKSK